MKAFVEMEEHMVNAGGSLSRLLSVRAAKSLINLSGPYIIGPRPVSIALIAVVIETGTSRQQ